MKKFIFSAVAMIAFVGSSRANNEVEIKPSEGININKFVLVDSDTPCADQWSSDVQFFQDYIGVSFKKAMRLADAAFDKCLEDLYGSN